eukprot:m.177519 g.177519  ORF g.177519 m.177519 type:complete len:1089 (+) comp16573_c0_seq2:234-3500(+)
MSSYDWTANRVRWEKLFAPPIKKMLRKMYQSSFSITDSALALLDERVYNILAHLCSIRGGLPTSRAAAEDAITKLFPESVSEWILEACRAAVAAQGMSRQRSDSRRFFCFDKIHSILTKDVAREAALPIEVSVVLVSALEELTIEILKFATSYAQQLGETIISEETLHVTMEARLDISSLLEKCSAPPTVQAYIKLNYSDSIRDCFAAETNFLNFLDSISKVFVDTFETQLNLPEATINEIFFNLSDLLEIVQNMATDFEDALDKANIHKSLPVVGDSFLNFTESKDHENFVSYGLHLPQALEALYTLTHDEEQFKAMVACSPELALAAKYDLPYLLQAPVHHLKHYVEALTSILSKAARSTDHFVHRSVPLLQDALSILKPAAGTFTADKFPMLEKREHSLEFPTMEARVSHVYFDRLKNTIDGAQEVDLFKPRYNLLHQGPVSLDDKSVYIMVLEHMFLVCKENPTRKSYRFRLKATINTKDLVIHLDELTDQNIVFSAEGKKMKLKVKDRDAYEAWLGALARIVSQRYVAHTLKLRVAEYERNLPDMTPDCTNYPFTEPDTPNTIRFDETKVDADRPIPLIKGGTLYKLIERLTHPQYVDLQYVTQFLLTFRMFCAPEELLDLLLWRYEVPLPKDISDKPMLIKRFRKRYDNPTKLRVLNVLKLWVDKHFYDFTGERSKGLIRKLLVFIQQEVQTGHQRERQCQAVIRCIQNHKSKKARAAEQLEHIDPPSDTLWLPVDASTMHVLTLHPVEVARQLTLIDSALYRAIQPSELVGQQWTKKNKETGSPNVLAFIRQFNRVSHWVIRTIVETTDLDERQLTLQAFLEVLFELRRLNNFNSLMALLAALRISAVNRLQLTWAAVSSRRKELFAEIEEQVGGQNYSHLRAAVSQATPPCIPFLGVYLTDITFMEDGSPDFLTPDPAFPDSGKEIINFTKRRLVAETCSTIQQFQNRTYNFQPVPAIQNYLEALPSTSPTPIPLPDGSKESVVQFEVAAYDQSLVIEPRGASNAPSGRKLITNPKIMKALRDAILQGRHTARPSIGMLSPDATAGLIHSSLSVGSAARTRSSHSSSSALLQPEVDTTEA